MARFAVLIFLLQLVLAVVALIGCLSADEAGIRGLPRLVWVVIIVLVPFVGPVAWFLAGRPRPAAAAPGTRGGTRSFPERGRPVAPDDNPEFLRSIEQGKADRERERELFDKWEQDLRKREDKLREDKLREDKLREDKLREEKDDPKPGSAET
jgi:phospholipase D-like protein